MAAFGKFDVLGHGALVAGDHTRGATVTADDALQTLVLSRTAFERLVEDGTIAQETHERARTMSRVHSQKDAARIAAQLQAEMGIAPGPGSD